MAKEYTRDVSFVSDLPGQGKVLYHTLFSDTVSLEKYGGVGDAFFELDPNVPYTGPNSLYMATRTTGQAEGDSITAYIPLYMPPSKLITALYRFLVPDLTTVKQLTILINVWDGTNLRTAYARVVPGTNTLTRNNEAAGSTEITDWVGPLTTGAWQFVSLALDFNSDTFRSLIINGEKFDLTDIPFQSQASATDPYMEIQFDIDAEAAGPAAINIGETAVLEA